MATKTIFRSALAQRSRIGSGRYRLRRTVRTAIDIAAIGPVLADALARSTDADAVRAGGYFQAICGDIEAIRAQLVLIDADEDVYQRTVDQNDISDESLEPVEAVWELAGIASRLVFNDRALAVDSDRDFMAQALSEEQRHENRRQVALEAFAGRSVLSSRPLRHLIDVSSMCNLRCRTCYQSDSQDFIYYDIATAGVAGLLSAMPFAEYANISGTGEPLLSATAPALVQGYAEIGAEVELTTNGTMPSRLNLVTEWTSAINISVDGATARTFETIRHGADLEKVVAGIRGLSDAARAKINLNCVVSRPNAHEAGALVDLAASIGVGHVTFQELNAYLPWHADMRLRPADREMFFDSLDRHTEPSGDGPVRVIVHVSRNSEQTTTDETTPDAPDVLDALARIPTVRPRKLSWSDLTTALEQCASPAIDFLTRLASKVRLAEARPVESSPEILLKEIRDRIDAGTAVGPSCMAPFSLLYLQGDGAMRPCCVLRTQVSSLRDRTFESAWNDPAFVAFRQTLLGERPAHPACLGCKDGNRFGGMIEALAVLEGEGLDIRKIGRPPSLDPPESIARHPLMLAWGADVGR